MDKTETLPEMIKTIPNCFTYKTNIINTIVSHNRINKIICRNKKIFFNIIIQYVINTFLYVFYQIHHFVEIKSIAEEISLIREKL